MGTPSWLGQALAYTGLNVLGGAFGAHQQQQLNLQLADRQHQQNMELLKYQLQYNSPKSQMARFAEAGLNPNLIYSQGSSGGMESAPRYPDVQSANLQAVLSGLGTQVQQSRLLASQADLTDQKVQESGIKQELNKMQTALIQANPYLNQSYVKALVTQMEAQASIKFQEEQWTNANLAWDWKAKEQRVEQNRVVYQRMQRELDLLAQRFNLNEADQRIKAEVLKSKEFQNALQKIQVDWMQNGDFTSEHIRQGIMLLLQKLF